MRIDGIQLIQGSSISNLVVASGTSFPSSPDEGELFFRTDAATNVKGLYAYIGGSWDRIASTDSLTAPLGANFPASANTGDLFYRDSNDSNESLYVYNGSAWVTTAAAVSFAVTGDVTGTLDGSPDVLTLATVATAGTVGDAASSTVVTINAKGLTTSVTATPIAIAASQTTSGTFADARISQSSVKQHQAALELAASQTLAGTFADGRISQSSVTQYQTALALAASQITSGTFADARISQASVTQHQAALSIGETQISDGGLLARVAGNETITGNWTFNNPVISAEPSSASHLTTKGYVDNALLGLTWKRSVKVATTANITLSGTQTIDGVAIGVGSRVLVKNQTTQSENGVYIVAAGAWIRSTDFDNVSPIDEVNSAAVFVETGVTQSDTGWTQASQVTTIGTDPITFVQFSAAGAYAAGSGLTLNGNIFNIGTASTSRIVVNVDDIDLAAVANSGTGTFQKLNIDSYGRVSGTTPVIAADITGLIDSTYVNVSGDTMTGNLVFNNATYISSKTVGGTTTRMLGINGSNDIYLGSIDAATGGSFLFLNGTERMRIDSAGNVGVGTSAPAYRMHIASAQPAALGVFRDLDVTSAGAAGTFIELGARNGSTFVAGASIIGVLNNPATTGYLTFSTLSTTLQERMRITQSGDIGVGTTGPVGRLSVVTSATSGGTIPMGLTLNNPTAYGAGTGLNGVGIRFAHTPNDAGSTGVIADIVGVSEQETSSTTGALAFRTRTGVSEVTTERMRITSAGDVGIGSGAGATSPQSGLHLSSAAGGGDVPRMRFSNSATGHTATDGAFLGMSNSTDFDMYNFEAGNIRFGTNSAIRMVVDNAGNVGINTASPSSFGQFSVVNTAARFVSFTPTVGASFAKFRYDDNSAAQVQLHNLGMNAANQGIALNWALGSDSATAINAGRILVAGENQWTATASTQNSFMQFATTAAGAITERMRITSAGDVGIGTATVTAKLDVVNTGDGGMQYRTGTRTVGIGQVSSEASVYWGSGTALTFFAGTERMRIDSAGRVGIGRIPSALTTLDAQGVGQSLIRIRGGAGASEGGAFYVTLAGSDSTAMAMGNPQAIVGGAASTDAMIWSSGALISQVGGGERMRITAAGDVGIGTAAPAGVLDVRPVQATAGVGSSVIIKAQRGATSNAGGNVLISSGDNGTGSVNGYIAFGIGAVLSSAAFTAGEAMRITSAGVIQDGAGLELGWKTIPQNSRSAAYTLVASDSGKHLLHPSADTTARIFTIPANASVAFPIGTAVTFVNQNGAGVVTIAITTDIMRLAGTGATGNRTLAANGIATAMKITATEWIISGTGLT